MPHLELEQETSVETEQKIKHMPRWHVILLDDNDHSYEYVITMLMKLFGHQPQRAFRMAQEVDNTGQVIVDTTSRERAELKQEQIHGFGADPLIPACSGSMTAILEAAK